MIHLVPFHEPLFWMKSHLKGVWALWVQCQYLKRCGMRWCRLRFGVVPQEPSFRTKPLSDHAKKMLHTIAQDNLSVFRKNQSGRGVNCPSTIVPFVVHKSALKERFIFHSVELNEKDATKPPHFALPTLDELACFLWVMVGGGWTSSS